MAVFRELSDFEPGVIVSFGDDVYIANIHYKVCTFTLTRSLAKPEDDIFKLLKIEDKVKFCEEIYGYKSDLSLHGFPHFKSNDYEVATRVVKKLMAQCVFKKRFSWFFGIKFSEKIK